MARWVEGHICYDIFSEAYKYTVTLEAILDLRINAEAGHCKFCSKMAAQSAIYLFTR